jgi:hypothetical protein
LDDSSSKKPVVANHQMKGILLLYDLVIILILVMESLGKALSTRN